MPYDNRYSSVLFGYLLDTKIFSNLERNNMKKQKSLLITLTFCLEDEDHKEVNFNKRTLAITLQFMKNQFQAFTFTI